METLKKLPAGTRVKVTAGRYRGKNGWIRWHQKPELKETHYAVNLDPANRKSGPVVYLGFSQVEADVL